jgi:hypothetical protein
MPTSEWTQVNIEEGNGQTIDPIEWAGDEVEVVNITDEELKGLRDASGEISSDMVFEWCLPRYDDDDEILFEFQAATM